MISQSIDQVIYLDFNDALTFEMAESLAIDRPEFEEYVDVEQALLQELAPSLTDEQASTVQAIYPEWNPEETYSVGDRVRYSNGFYKCLQEHNAQINWNPSSAASLWAAIIDATVLPIGEYPLWQQPDSVNPYSKDDIVTFNEQLWISIIDNNVWAPGIYGWEIYVEENPEGETGITSNEFGETGITGITGTTGMTGETGITSDEQEPQTIIGEWIQPDSTNPYMTGDKVRYNNSIWESTIDNNVWAPGVYGWQEVAE